MNILNEIQDLIEIIFNFDLKLYSIIFFSFLIITCHILVFLLRDRKYIDALKKFKDPETVKLEDLKEQPLINIIIPAWKEGKLFKDCLSSIAKLDYPNLKVIVNAGGNDKTIEIAKSFENYKYFIILEQKPGGKIKALNDCLKCVNEGIVYSIDADVFLTDEILLRLIYPIINQNEFVCSSGVKPLKFQQNRSIVKYTQLNRIYYFKHKFSRYGRLQVSGPNSCFKYEVIKKIKRFEEEDLYLQSDRFRGPLILKKGYKIYWLNHYKSLINTYYPDTLKAYFKQEIRWRKNTLLDPMKKNKGIIIFKFLILIFYSLIILSIPLFLILNYFLFVLIGLILLLNKYLIKLRRYIFFRITLNNKEEQRFGINFFIKLLFYIYLDAIITLYLGPDSLRSFFKKNKTTFK